MCPCSSKLFTLCSAFLLCLRPHAQDFTPGKPLQQCLSTLCKSNLHYLACKLPQQILYMGLTCFFLEYWVERVMGAAKKRTRGKITHKPGRQVVAMELDNRVQHKMALELGLLLQEDGEDGNGSLLVPADLSSGSGGGGGAGDGHSFSSRIDAMLQAPARSARYNWVGKGAQPTCQEWDDFEVSHCMQFNAIPGGS